MSTADQHADLGLPVSRRHPARKLLARALWPLLRHQVAYNRETLGELAQSQRQLVALEAQLARIEGDLEHHSAVLVRHERPLPEVTGALEDLLAAAGRYDEAFRRHDEAFRRHDETLERLDRDRGDLAERLDKDYERLEQRIELTQRQAFARYHEGNGALRRDLTEITQHFTGVADDLTHDVTEFVGEAAKRLDSLDEEHRESATELTRTTGAQLSRIRDGITRHDLEIARSLAEQRVRLSEVDLFLAAVKRSLPLPPDVDTLGELPAASVFVREAIEDATAEPTPLLRERLAHYLELVRGSAALGPLLDLTPRNGDWLEVLAAAGVASYGVVANPSRATVARVKGLDVRPEDPLTHLRAVAPGSLGAISGFGLIEGLDFEQVIELFDLAARALHPGGAVLLECLNPSNLVVATSVLHADPGTRRPIPQESLAFIAGIRGFVDIAITLTEDAMTNKLEVPQPEKAPWAEDLSPIIALLNERLFGAAHYSLLALRP